MRKMGFIKALLLGLLLTLAQGQALARYVQADPIGLEGGFNRFGYVDGDALNDVDPEGLQSRKDPKALRPLDEGGGGGNSSGGYRFGGGTTGGMSPVDGGRAPMWGGGATGSPPCPPGGRILYHYTDAAGARGISQSGSIQPDSKGRVFFTERKLSPEEVRNTLFIGRSGGKGSHVVEFRPAGGLAIGSGKNANELIHKGTIRDGRHGTMTVTPND